MQIVFTKNDLPLSRFIRWALEEPVSHVALVFSDTFVVHASLFGVEVESFVNFKKMHEIIHSISCKEFNDFDKLKQVVTVYDGASYDYKLLLYLGWRAILKRLLRCPLPEKFRDPCDNHYLCMEFVESVLGMETDTVSSPYKLYLRLR